MLLILSCISSSLCCIYIDSVLFIVKLIKLLFFRLFCYRISDSGEIKIFITQLFDASWILGSVESYCRIAIGGRVSSLWSSYRLDKKLFMAALWNRAGHYIFMLWFLSIFFYISIFFSSPNLSGRRLDVYHTSTHAVALVRIRMQV